MSLLPLYLTNIFLQEKVSNNVCLFCIHFPLNGATYEEIILRQKELESNYFYYMSFGLSYTFGSMKNNVVTPIF